MFLNENVRISINISLKFVPKVPIDNIPALVQIMTWHRPGDKLLSEPMMVRLLMHICITRPQWVKRCPMFIAVSNRSNQLNYLIMIQILNSNFSLFFSGKLMNTIQFLMKSAGKMVLCHFYFHVDKNISFIEVVVIGHYQMFWKTLALQ